MLKCQWNTTSFQSVHLFIVYTISETSQDSADGVAPQGCVLNACTKGVHVMLSTLLSYAATSKQAPDPGDCLQPNSSMQFPVVSMQEKMDFKASHTPNLKKHNPAETELHTNSFWCENQKAKVSIHIAIYYQRLLVQDRSQLNWRFFGQGLASILTIGMTWWVPFLGGMAWNQSHCPMDVLSLLLVNDGCLMIQHQCSLSLEVQNPPKAAFGSTLCIILYHSYP